MSDRRLDVPSARAAGHRQSVRCRKCNEEMTFRKGTVHEPVAPICPQETPIPYTGWFCPDPDCGYTITHPEFLDFAAEIARQVTTTINAGAPQIESDMPYKSQYALELVIELLEECV